ncbi:MAG: hypothetical protein CL759_06870 [Chloroflexi bacterium]|nr:hypothetical protein [Chloroflexota bacterium]
MTTRCKECQGTNVQRAMWVRVNTDETLDQVFDDSYSASGAASFAGTWCEDCEAHTELRQRFEVTP